MFALMFFALVLVTSPVTADARYRYEAVIAQSDLKSSAGASLTDIASILQQDRANFHRFGIRQPGDAPDPFFADPAVRAQIADIYRPSARDDEITMLLGFGAEIKLQIEICLRSDRPAAIGVVYNNGDSDVCKR